MVAVSYPGVYIEELPSAVHTVTGVATSITAFIGRALRGPTNEPVLITCFADFEREYGGLWTQSSLSYAVQQFYQNGGTLAVIVRIVHELDLADSAGVAAAAATLPATTTSDTWTFQARDAGPAGNSLDVTVVYPATALDDVGRFDVSIDDGSGPEELELEFTSALYWVELDNPTVPLQSGSPLGTGRVTLEGGIPPVRPMEASGQALEHGASVTFATVTIDGATFTARNGGSAGNDLVADVFDAAVDAQHYDLLVSLLDADGIAVASERYPDVVPGGAWPEPVRDSAAALLDTSAPVPEHRPAATTAPIPFAGGTEPTSATTTIATDLTLPILPLEAANPGAWGNALQAKFDDDTADGSPPPVDPNHRLFNLTLRELRKDGQGGSIASPIEEVTRETFRNVSLDPNHARFLDKVLEDESKLARVVSSGCTLPKALPDTWFNFTAGADGEPLQAADYTGSQLEKTGIYALERADLFNLLVIPPPTLTVGDETEFQVWSEALTYCKRRRAILLVDAPSSWKAANAAAAEIADGSWPLSGLQGADATNAAIYWPRIKVADPLREYRIGEFTPSGAIAGVIARTDAERGVWKAPAGVEASLSGVSGLAVSLTDLENGLLNPLGINVLRTFPLRGSVVWGARTLDGADRRASQWKYLPVRRLALYLEESLYRGTQWAVFEPNDEPLWGQLRLNIGTFMFDLFRQGAFQGRSPREAYLVKCDRETTTQSDIDRGIVNVIVAFAPLKPAEFIVLKIAQLAGQ